MGFAREWIDAANKSLICLLKGILEYFHTTTYLPT